MGGVTPRNAEKVDKSVAAIIAKSRIKFHFLQRLLQQKVPLETSCCLGMLAFAIFGATYLFIYLFI